MEVNFKGLNENSSPDPNSIMPVLIQNGAKTSQNLGLSYCEVVISWDIFQNFGTKKITEYTLKSLTKQIITYPIHADLFCFQIS